MTIHAQGISDILTFLTHNTYSALTPYYYKCLYIGHAHYGIYSVTKGTLKMVQWDRNMYVREMKYVMHLYFVGFLFDSLR